MRGMTSFVLSRKLIELKSILKVWNKESFGNLGANKKMALDQVEAWDNLEIERDLTLEESEAKKEAKENYKKWVILEETHWRQKSRELWLRAGDKNTGFFHRMANSHFRSNSLVIIKINGAWLTEGQEIREGVANAFQQFLSDKMERRAELDGLTFTALNSVEASSLEVPFREDEILFFAGDVWRQGPLP